MPHPSAYHSHGSVQERAYRMKKLSLADAAYQALCLHPKIGQPDRRTGEPENTLRHRSLDRKRSRWGKTIRFYSRAGHAGPGEGVTLELQRDRD